MAAEAERKTPPKWAEMLADVEQALTAAVEAADRRTQALDAAPVQPAAVDLSAGLARFGERLRGLTECVARAEQSVTRADGELAAGEEALRAWFQQAEAARRKLADWVDRA
jgi:hypothetical protein